MLTTRRVLLLGAALAASAPPLLNPSPSSAQPTPNPLRVRRDIYTLSPTGADVAALRRGVAAMMRKPVTDPTSWAFQAAIHGTYTAPPAGMPADRRAVWNSCRHGDWNFLSWHRVYLYYFERILRAASGDSRLTLPYWNYEPPAQRALPLAFRSPTQNNALYVAARNDGTGPDPRTRINVNRGDPIPASVVHTTRALGSLQFGAAGGIPIGFTNLLEQQPHNILHVVLGGGGLMADPNTAARDPIFWLHHCNVDRLWSRWIQQGGRANPAVPQWRDRPWTFFDERGQRVQMTASQVLETARQLNYRYDDDPFPGAVALTGPAQESAAPITEVAAVRGVSLDRRQGTALTLTPNAQEAARVLGGERGAPTLLVLEGFEYTGPQSTWYEIYANLPAGTEPDPEGPYFVGNLALFALNRRPEHTEHGEEPPRAVFDLGQTLLRQRREGLWRGGEVQVTLVPRGPVSRTESATPAPRIGSIRIVQ